MIEYLVRRTDGDWFDFPPGSEPYAPISIPYSKIEGAGDARIAIDGCEISFSYEDSGIQVSFDGEISASRAAEIVEQIRQRIEQVSGQSASAIQIA